MSIENHLLQNMNIFSSIGNDFKKFGDDTKGAFDKFGDNTKKDFDKFGDNTKKDFDKFGDNTKKDFDKFGNNTKAAFDNAGKVINTGLIEFAHGATADEKKFIVDVKVAAHKVGPYFKIAEKDLEWAGKETWKGIKWCYNTPPCKAAAEKYGLIALRVGLTAALAQQQQMIIILI